MSVSPEVVAEIKSQLADDILHYGWLYQIVRAECPAQSDEQCVESVLDGIMLLHQSGLIVVGNAREVDGKVVVQPWQESNHELRVRLASTIAASAEMDRDFCFWIQLKEHFAAADSPV